MTRTTTDAAIDAALRSLDAAPGGDLSEPEHQRADQLFDRIVATPPDAVTDPAPGQLVPARRRRRGLLAGAGVVVVAVVTAPALLLGGGGAYGSWTATPEPLPADAAAAAAETCRATLAVPDEGEGFAIAERRGAWTYVLLVGPGMEAACLMPNDDEGRPVGDRDGFLGSYDLDPPAPPALGPEDLEETTSMSNNTDDGEVVWVEGYVGSDVAGVTVHTSSGLDITASVVEGRFAAWWPSVVQSSENPEGESWSYTAHLADGEPRSFQ